MNAISPLKLILIGFVLLVLGFLLPFAMVVGFIEPTLLLSFVAYLSSLVGLWIGLYGLILLNRARQ